MNLCLLTKQEDNGGFIRKNWMNGSKAMQRMAWEGSLAMCAWWIDEVIATGFGIHIWKWIHFEFRKFRLYPEKCSYSWDERVLYVVVGYAMLTFF